MKLLNRKTIIVDIDGTLANLDHRLHHIGKGPKVKDVETTEESRAINWEEFHKDCLLDTPIEATCQLVRELADADWCVIMVTGRGAENRDNTETWLGYHDIPYDLLLMRTTGNHEPDVDVKRRWLRMLNDGRISVPGMSQPIIALEDRSRTINMWREEGLIGLQCDEGDF